MQGKFPVAPHNVEAASETPGNNIQTRSLVVLNALGFIGFKVLGVAGNYQVNKNNLNNHQLGILSRSISNWDLNVLINREVFLKVSILFSGVYVDS